MGGQSLIQINLLKKQNKSVTKITIIYMQIIVLIFVVHSVFDHCSLQLSSGVCQSR